MSKKNEYLKKAFEIYLNSKLHLHGKLKWHKNEPIYKSERGLVTDDIYVFKMWHCFKAGYDTCLAECFNKLLLKEANRK